MSVQTITPIQAFENWQKSNSNFLSKLEPSCLEVDTSNTIFVCVNKEQPYYPVGEFGLKKFKIEKQENSIMVTEIKKDVKFLNIEGHAFALPTYNEEKFNSCFNELIEKCESIYYPLG